MIRPSLVSSLNASSRRLGEALAELDDEDGRGGRRRRTTVTRALLPLPSPINRALSSELAPQDALEHGSGRIPIRLDLSCVDLRGPDVAPRS